MCTAYKVIHVVTSCHGHNHACKCRTTRACTDCLLLFLITDLKSRYKERAFLDKPRQVGRPAGRPAADVRRDSRRRRPCCQRHRKKKHLIEAAPLAASIKCCGRTWSGEALPPPAKNPGVWGAASPSQKRNVIKKPFLEKVYEEKQKTVWFRVLKT